MLRAAIIAGLILGLAHVAAPRQCQAQSVAFAATDLKDLLEKGLRASRPEEFAFIGVVLAKIESGELSESIVRATFLWARQHPNNTFQYFQFGIRERAKKLGVTL